MSNARTIMFFGLVITDAILICNVLWQAAKFFV